MGYVDTLQNVPIISDLVILLLRYSTTICFCKVMLVSQTWIFYTLEVVKLIFDVRFRLLIIFP